MLCTARSAIRPQLSHEGHCWVIRDDPKHVIPVKIAISETIGHLKEAIKEKIKHSFPNLDAKSLDLCKVSNY